MHKHIFSLLLLTSNEPLGVHVPQFGNPCSMTKSSQCTSSWLLAIVWQHLYDAIGNSRSVALVRHSST